MCPFTPLLHRPTNDLCVMPKYFPTSVAAPPASAAVGAKPGANRAEVRYGDARHCVNNVQDSAPRDIPSQTPDQQVIRRPIGFCRSNVVDRRRRLPSFMEPFVVSVPRPRFREFWLAHGYSIDITTNPYPLHRFHLQSIRLSDCFSVRHHGRIERRDFWRNRTLNTSYGAFAF